MLDVDPESDAAYDLPLQHHRPVSLAAVRAKAPNPKELAVHPELQLTGVRADDILRQRPAGYAHQAELANRAGRVRVVVDPGRATLAASQSERQHNREQDPHCTTVTIMRRMADLPCGC